MISYELEEKLRERGLEAKEFGERYWVSSIVGYGRRNLGLMTREQVERLARGERLD